MNIKKIQKNNEELIQENQKLKDELNIINLNKIHH